VVFFSSLLLNIQSNISILFLYVKYKCTLF